MKPLREESAQKCPVTSNKRVPGSVISLKNKNPKLFDIHTPCKNKHHKV